MEKKKPGRPKKKKVEVKATDTDTFDNITVNTTVVREYDESIVSELATVHDKAYFKSKLETLAAEISLAIKTDRSLSIRLKSVYVSINQAAKKL